MSTLIERLKVGMYDVPFSTAELMREAIAALRAASVDTEVARFCSKCGTRYVLPEYRGKGCCLGPDPSIGERMP